MVKDPRSIYSPGRRGLGWLKMKKALATIDCVVVGVEVGHGKRHGVLSDYTFAVRDTDNDRLVTIGKAYSGLTDAEIAEMTALVRGPHDRPLRALPPGRADGRRRGRVRRDRPLEAPPVGLLAALPADRAPPARQVARRDRHARDGRRALYEGLQHGAEQLVTAGARTASAGSAGLAHESGCPARFADAYASAMFERARRASRPRHPDPVHRRVRHQGPDPDAGRGGSPTSSTRPTSDFLVLSRHGLRRVRDRGTPVRAEFAQVNLGAVLFAVADDDGRAVGPTCGRPKVAEQALISIPPFKVTGRIHLLPERDLREALSELDRPVHPVTDADLLVGLGRRGPPDGADGRDQPRSGPRSSRHTARSIRGPALGPRGRSVGGAGDGVSRRRTIARPRRHRRGLARPDFDR